MDFQNAIEFCAVRKLELMAFDTALETQNKKWTNKKYFEMQLFLEDTGCIYEKVKLRLNDMQIMR